MTLKKRVYNSYSEFSRLLGLTFAESGKFWKYVDDDTRTAICQSSEKSTIRGSKEWAIVKDRVDTYPLTGPLGCQDPKLPVCTRELHRELNDPSSDLQSRWKKRNLTAWAKTLDRPCPMYRLSKRAAATFRSMRVAGDQCLEHSRKRVYAMTKLKRLRVELMRAFKEDYGVDFGLTVGIKLKDNGQILWFDIVLMT